MDHKINKEDVDSSLLVILCIYNDTNCFQWVHLLINIVKSIFWTCFQRKQTPKKWFYFYFL